MLYAVPRDISNMVIYYNKDMFRAKGVAFPCDNWKMREFLHTAQRLTERPRVFGVSFEEDPVYWLPFLMNADIDFYADLRRKYHVAPAKQESASATMAQMFLQKRLAMHISGRWMVPKYRQEADFDWGVATFPGIVSADASGWAIAKSSKHPEEAQKLVDFLSSHDVEFVKSGLIVPARRANSGLISEKAFLKAIQNSRPTPVSKDYIRQMDRLKEELHFKSNL
jgi:multiple sugar transport system substrate-binding protein